MLAFFPTPLPRRQAAARAGTAKPGSTRRQGTAKPVPRREDYGRCNQNLVTHTDSRAAGNDENHGEYSPVGHRPHVLL